MNWNPIDTAPKDRPVLLHYRWGDGGSRYAVGRWDDDHYAHKPRPYWSATAQPSFDRANTPTHWAELTPPEDVPRG